jgi:nitrilase
MLYCRRSRKSRCQTCSLSRDLDPGIPDVVLVLAPENLSLNTDQNFYPSRKRPVDFDLGVRYVQNSLKIESQEMQRIRDAAAAHKIAISLGFSERDGDSVYIAQALIDHHGEIKMKRRKMKLTHMERTIFGDASGDSLASIVDLPGVGRVGCLSCWEHNQPLLKYYTLSQHEQIHIAGWPPLDPFVKDSTGFWSMSAEGTSRIYIKNL